MSMPKGSKAQPDSKLSAALIGGIIVAVVIIGGIAFLAMRNGGDGTNTSDREYVPVPGFADVHGLATSPENADIVYVATHHGLIRGENGSWARVGSMQDDLMGFSMHPTNASTFWTSGHPKTGGNMGVRQSTDGGFTWTTLWSESVDFHAMTVSPADPTKLWGYWRGELHKSTNGGRAWTIAGEAPAMRALTAHPTQVDRLYATTQAGISTSPDGGETWMPIAGIPAFGIAIDPVSPSINYAGGQNALWKSVDGGATWTSLAPPERGAFAYLAVSPTRPATLYSATYEAGVYRSDDSGATWTTIMTPSR